MAPPGPNIFYSLFLILFCLSKKVFKKGQSCRMLRPALKKTRKLKKVVLTLSVRKRLQRLFLFSKFFSFTPAHAAGRTGPRAKIYSNHSEEKENP